MAEELTNRRLGRPEAGGFALIGALFVVVGIAGVAFIALMSMTLTASKVSVSENATARDVRAADNALESTVNLLRMDPQGELGLTDKCIDPAGIDFESNGRTVNVTGSCEESTLSMADVDPSVTADAPAVRLVGADGYQSGTNWADTVRWGNDCLLGDPALGSCAPWALGIGPSNYSTYSVPAFAAARPSLVHTAADDPTNPALGKTLNFAADVQARRGSATMIPPSEQSPAVKVAGEYQQGDQGLFVAQGTVDCGVSTVGHPWNVLGAQISDSDTTSLGLPTCGSTATEALALNSRSEIAPRPLLGGSFTTFAATPSCSASVGGVVQLSPGAYGKAQTAALNQLLGGACPNRTFWFSSTSATELGSYWFDVDDTSNANRNLWNTLTINDPTVRVIFGTPTGGFSASAAANAAFPQACNAEAAGVEIELSPRTTLRHLAGQVAVCDGSDQSSTSNQPAAIWQAGNADGGWQGAAVPSQSVATVNQVVGGVFGADWLPWNSGSATISTPDNSWLIDDSFSEAKFTCTIIFNGKCAGDVTYQARGIAAATASQPGRLDSLDLLVRAQTEGTERSFTLWSGGQIGTELRFYRASDLSTPACAVYFPFVPDSIEGPVSTFSYDLLSTTADQVGSISRCSDVDLNRADVDGAGVDVTFRLNKNVSFGFGTYTNKIYMDGVELRSGWDLTGSTAVAGSGWSNAENVLATDGSHSGYTLSGCGWTGSCPSATRQVSILGFDNTISPHVPVDGALESAGVIVTGESTDRNFFVSGSFYDREGEPDIWKYSWMRVTISNLRDVPSGSCVATWSRVPFWGQGVYLDLLDPAVAGSCASVLTNAEQLIGATAVLEVHVERNDRTLGGATFGTRIDSVKLSTVTTGEYTRPRSPMVTTVDTSAGSSLNVFGQVSMPRNDLNIRWNGPSPVDAEGESVAIGGGNMILSALGSYVAPGGEAGVVCCSPTRPAERIVDLVATIDGNIEGRARVVVSDVGGPGSGLRIEDWEIGDPT